MGDILEINTWAAELQSNRMEDYADDLRRLKSNLNDLEGNLTFVNQIKGFKDDFQQMTQLIKQYFKFLKTLQNYIVTHKKKSFPQLKV